MAIAVVSAIAGAAYVSWSVNDSRWKAKWSQRDAADELATRQALQRTLDVERYWQDRFTKAEDDYQKRLKGNKDAADKTIALYRSGQQRLRYSLDCTARSLSGASSAASVRDAATTCGLRAEDVEFLIRYAERADGVAEQLARAQAILKAIYDRQPPATK